MAVTLVMKFNHSALLEEKYFGLIWCLMELCLFYPQHDFWQE